MKYNSNINSLQRNKTYLSSHSKEKLSHNYSNLYTKYSLDERESNSNHRNNYKINNYSLSKELLANTNFDDKIRYYSQTKKSNVRDICLPDINSNNSWKYNHNINLYNKNLNILSKINSTIQKIREKNKIISNEEDYTFLSNNNPTSSKHDNNIFVLYNSNYPSLTNTNNEVKSISKPINYNNKINFLPINNFSCIPEKIITRKATLPKSNSNNTNNNNFAYSNEVNSNLNIHNYSNAEINNKELSLVLNNNSIDSFDQFNTRNNFNYKDSLASNIASMNNLFQNNNNNRNTDTTNNIGNTKVKEEINNEKYLNINSNASISSESCKTNKNKNIINYENTKFQYNKKLLISPKKTKQYIKNITNAITEISFSIFTENKDIVKNTYNERQNISLLNINDISFRKLKLILDNLHNEFLIKSDKLKDIHLIFPIKESKITGVESMKDIINLFEFLNNNAIIKVHYKDILRLIFNNNTTTFNIHSYDSNNKINDNSNRNNINHIEEHSGRSAHNKGNINDNYNHFYGRERELLDYYGNAISTNKSMDVFGRKNKNGIEEEKSNNKFKINLTNIVIIEDLVNKIQVLEENYRLHFTKAFEYIVNYMMSSSLNQIKNIPNSIIRKDSKMIKELKEMRTIQDSVKELSKSAVNPSFLNNNNTNGNNNYYTSPDNNRKHKLNFLRKLSPLKKTNKAKSFIKEFCQTVKLTPMRHTNMDISNINSSRSLLNNFNSLTPGDEKDLISTINQKNTNESNKYLKLNTTNINNANRDSQSNTANLDNKSHLSLFSNNINNNEDMSNNTINKNYNYFKTEQDVYNNESNDEDYNNENDYTNNNIAVEQQPVSFFGQLRKIIEEKFVEEEVTTSRKQSNKKANALNNDYNNVNSNITGKSAKKSYTKKTTLKLNKNLDIKDEISSYPNITSNDSEIENNNYNIILNSTSKSKFEINPNKNFIKKLFKNKSFSNSKSPINDKSKSKSKNKMTSNASIKIKNTISSSPLKSKGNPIYSKFVKNYGKKNLKLKSPISALMEKDNNTKAVLKKKKTHANFTLNNSIANNSLLNSSNTFNNANRNSKVSYSGSNKKLNNSGLKNNHLSSNNNLSSNYNFNLNNTNNLNNMSNTSNAKSSNNKLKKSKKSSSKKDYAAKSNYLTSDYNNRNMINENIRVVSKKNSNHDTIPNISNEIKDNTHIDNNMQNSTIHSNKESLIHNNINIITKTSNNSVKSSIKSIRTNKSKNSLRNNIINNKLSNKDNKSNIFFSKTSKKEMNNDNRLKYLSETSSQISSTKSVDSKINRNNKSNTKINENKVVQLNKNDKMSSEKVVFNRSSLNNNFNNTNNESSSIINSRGITVTQENILSLKNLINHTNSNINRKLSKSKKSNKKIKNNKDSIADTKSKASNTKNTHNTPNNQNKSEIFTNKMIKETINLNNNDNDVDVIHNRNESKNSNSNLQKFNDLSHSISIDKFNSKSLNKNMEKIDNMHDFSLGQVKTSNTYLNKNVNNQSELFNSKFDINHAKNNSSVYTNEIVNEVSPSWGERRKIKEISFKD